MLFVGTINHAEEYIYKNNICYRTFDKNTGEEWNIVRRYWNSAVMATADDHAELAQGRLRLMEQTIPLIIIMPADCLPITCRDCLPLIQSYIDACRPWPMHPRKGLGICGAMAPVLDVDNMEYAGTNAIGLEVYTGITYNNIPYYAHHYGTRFWRLDDNFESNFPAPPDPEDSAVYVILEEKYRQITFPARKNNSNVVGR